MKKPREIGGVFFVVGVGLKGYLETIEKLCTVLECSPNELFSIKK
jgi:hypothetical protein